MLKKLLGIVVPGLSGASNFVGFHNVSQLKRGYLKFWKETIIN